MADKVILGKNCVYSTDCEETGLNNNVIVCGSSGCGKTMSISEPCLLEVCRSKNSSLIITVTKRRIVEKYKPILEKEGFEVLDLNFVHPLEGNVGYDPLVYSKSYKDMAFLAEAIVKAGQKSQGSNADPYWENAAVSLLSAECAYVQMTMAEPTFADVLEMHGNLQFRECRMGTIETSYDSRFEYLARKKPNCFAVSCWKTFRCLPIRTANCVFSSLNTTIDKVFSPQLQKMFTMENMVDFEKLASKKTVLFVTTSPVNPALHSFVNLFYSHAFKELFEFAERRKDGVLPLPVHLLADDFATGSPILNFPEYISIFREKRISVTLLLQSESQLAAMYGQCDATTILNNCDTYVYMGGMDIRTAQNVSIRLNVPLDEVLYMPVGQVILFRRGQHPVVTKRYEIGRDELYQVVTKSYEEWMLQKKDTEPEKETETEETRTEETIEKIELQEEAADSIWEL